MEGCSLLIYTLRFSILLTFWNHIKIGFIASFSIEKGVDALEGMYRHVHDL